MQPGRVASKIALITGAGSGIGRATAKLMAQQGAMTIVSDIDLEAARKVAKDINSNLVTPGGVTTPMWEKEPFFQALIEQHGGTAAAFVALTGELPSRQCFPAE